jgi:hypothetical protein
VSKSEKETLDEKLNNTRKSSTSLVREAKKKINREEWNIKLLSSGQTVSFAYKLPKSLGECV